MFKTFLYLVIKEVIVFLKTYKSKFVDLVIIISTNIIVFTFIMPSFGLSTNFGASIAIGVISALALFEAIPRTTTLLTDIVGPRKISYIITLPIPSSLAIASLGVSWAANGFLYTVLVLPLVKLFMLSKLNLVSFSLIKFFIAFVSSHLMFGFFSLWLTTLLKDMKYVSFIWARVVNPMFMLGGYFYTWKAIFSLNHLAGYVNLVNPLIYSTESIRSAVFGAKDYIPFGYSILALWFLILLFAFLGIRGIKKRLDCV